MQTQQPNKGAKMGATKKLRGPEINFDSEEQRNLIEQAANSRGLSITAFIRSSSISAANEVLKEDRMLRLSDRDFDLASSTLESPPEPNDKLLSLLK